jgi:hypothetical protein
VPRHLPFFANALHSHVHTFTPAIVTLHKQAEHQGVAVRLAQLAERGVEVRRDLRPVAFGFRDELFVAETPQCLDCSGLVIKGCAFQSSERRRSNRFLLGTPNHCKRVNSRGIARRR